PVHGARGHLVRHHRHHQRSTGEPVLPGGGARDVPRRHGARRVHRARWCGRHRRRLVAAPERLAEVRPGMAQPRNTGVIASPHTLSSRAGAAMLARGGTAIDAAIAGAATIAVVYPHMNGIGGDNFWLIYDAAGACLRGLAGCGRSAASATPEWYRARGVTEA